jgi:hypothetical protein
VRLKQACLAIWLLLAPGLAWADCRLLEIAEFHTTPGQRRPMTDALIDGKPVKVLIDTGAARSLVPLHEAQQLGLVVAPVQGGRFYGVGGGRQMYTTHIWLAIGGAEKPDLELPVVGDPRKASPFSLVLGDDYFSQVDTEFDLPHDVIRLFKPQGCSPPQLVYWGAAYSQASIADWSLQNPAIQAQVLLNGKPVLATLDTGAFSTIVDAEVAAEDGVRWPPGEASAGPTVHGLGPASRETRIGLFDSIALGDERISNVRLLVEPLLGDFSYSETGDLIPHHIDSGPRLMLGADFFRAHRIFVDVKDRLLLFSYAGGTIFAPDAAPAR